MIKVTRCWESGYCVFQRVNPSTGNRTQDAKHFYRCTLLNEGYPNKKCPWMKKEKIEFVPDSDTGEV